MHLQVAKMLIKVPPDVKEWLARQAARNVSSQQAEVIRSVRDRMVREQSEKAVQR